ncbi:hypothetical protein [Maridesulfovibrio bastinii]|uniref:hypothetical protein n=1 Tax=Maridesulfovibrio bastinii TaxID=47157 RepID=UPI000414005B|nr:hypothetical protein [Maridesulfovibrio bastinii]
MRYLFKVAPILLILAFFSGCTPKIPKDALALSPQSMKDRERQTRYFETGDEQILITAGAQVLQDMGFNLQESEINLGVITASKHRDATDGGQIAGAILIAAFTGVAMPVDSDQLIRVSIVTRPIDFNKEVADKVTDKLRQKLTRKIHEKTEQVLNSELSGGLDGKIQQNLIKTVVTNLSDHFGDEVDAKLKTLLSSGKVAMRVTFQRIIYNTQRLATRMESITDDNIYQEFFDKLSKSVFLEAHNL